MPNLLTAEMIEVADVFQGSFAHVMSNIIGDAKPVIQNFVTSVVLQEKPYLLVTPEGLTHAINLVFTQEAHRDFIFNLTFVFFSRWGGNEDAVQGLIANVARGATQTYIDNKKQTYMDQLCAIPKEISTRLSAYSDVAALLTANKWLLMLLLLQLFIVAED